MQVITELAGQVDQLTPHVIQAALRVKSSAGDLEAKVQLDSSRSEWAQRVQQLTAAIDDIIDPEDFLAVSGVCGMYCEYSCISYASVYTYVCVTDHVIIIILWYPGNLYLCHTLGLSL